MSNNVENLTAARTSLSDAYAAHKEFASETDVHGAFRMLTREARRITRPTSGLGSSRRASRLARAKGYVKAASTLTQSEDVRGHLSDALASLDSVTVSAPEVAAPESEGTPLAWGVSDTSGLEF